MREISERQGRHLRCRYFRDGAGQVNRPLWFYLLPSYLDLLGSTCLYLPTYGLGYCYHLSLALLTRILCFSLLP